MCFFNDTATTEIYSLSLHDALPICQCRSGVRRDRRLRTGNMASNHLRGGALAALSQDADATDEKEIVRFAAQPSRSEEHTSELQSRQYLVCRLLLEKKTS